MNKSLSQLSNFLISSSPFKFNEKTLELLRNDLKPSQVIPEEIEDLLIHHGGKFFKPDSKLIFQETEYELLHIMGNSLEAVQKNLIKHVRDNPNLGLLPIIKLNRGFIYVRLCSGDQFGKICFDNYEDENHDFLNLQELIDYFSIKKA